MPEAPRLSIILPVYNEAQSTKMMVQILEATLEFPHEVLIVYDFPEDNTVPVGKWLQTKYDNVRLVHNDIGRGVTNAVRKGLEASRGNAVLITVVDEVFPIAAVTDMLRLIEAGCDMVSCTRYAMGGKRYGGSKIGGLLSRTANFLFRWITGSVFSDATTACKMFRRDVFQRMPIEAATGWAFGFETSIKAQVLRLKFGEVPIVSVDRLFGGESTFRLGPWLKEYLRWFFWGMTKINWLNRCPKPMTIQDLGNR